MESTGTFVLLLTVLLFYDKEYPVKSTELSWMKIKIMINSIQPNFTKMYILLDESSLW